MTRLLDVVQKLTDEDRRKVEAYAESLLARRQTDDRGAAVPSHRPIDYDGWVGCLAHVHPEMSDAQFKQLLRDAWVQTAERTG